MTLPPISRWLRRLTFQDNKSGDRLTVVAARIVQVGLGSFASFVLIGRRTIGPQQVSQINKFNGLRVKSTLAAVLIRKGIFPDCQKASS
jgi:hypothetical protein